MNRGDVEPVVSLLDADVDWCRRTRGHLRWKHVPSCHGPDEARKNLQAQITNRFWVAPSTGSDTEHATVIH